VTNLPGADANFHGTTAGANVNLGRVGGFTFTMTGALGHGGVTAFLGGSNTLRDDGSLLNTSEIILNYATFTIDTNGSVKRINNNRVSDTAPVSMRGGILVYSGIAREDVGERFGALTIAEGGNTLTANSGGGDYVTTFLSFPSLTRAAGTTVNFTGSNIGQPGSAARITFDAGLASQPNGILGAWAIANWNDYAAYDPINGVGVVGQGGFGAYDSNFGSNKNTQLVAVQDTTTALPAGGATAAVLKLTGRASNRVTFAAPTDVLNLQYGGLLRSNDAFDGIIGNLTNRGVLTAGGSEVSGVRELVVFNQARGNPTFTGGTITSGSSIVTGINTWGLRPGMTVTNPPGANNNPTGNHFIAGTTVLSVDSDTQVTLSTAATGSAGGSTLAGGSFVAGATNSGSAAVTMNSTVGIGPGMTISGTGIPVGAFVVSVDSATQVTISRPAVSNQTGQTWTVGVSELVINSVIANNGAGNTVRLVKSGDGTMTLTAANTFTGGTVLNQGVMTLTATANGTIVLPAGGVTVNGGHSGLFAHLNVLSQGAIDPSNAITINGSGRVTFPTLTTNTLSSLTFNNVGGEFGGSNLSFVGIGANSFLRLTSLAPVTATSSNARITSAINEGSLVLAAGNNVFDIAGIRLRQHHRPRCLGHQDR
jgi:autotransporter-associated beta strand protein